MSRPKIAIGISGGVDSAVSAYLLKKQYIPIFDDLISSQGMTFAKVDKAVIREAVEWAEIIHFLTPFALLSILCYSIGFILAMLRLRKL